MLPRRLIIGLAALAATTMGAPSASAIVGGQPATIAQAPWQVMLEINGQSLCGGSLISPTWVLTAAHCVRGIGPGGVRAYAGITRFDQRSEATALPVAAVIVHPQATSDYRNDVALVQLASPIQQTAERRVIALPVGQDLTTWPAVGATATVTGWGITTPDGERNPDELQSATVQILTDAAGTCGQYGGDYVGSNHLCAGQAAGGVDTCQGDSGGPLVVTLGTGPVLAGVTSVGVGCAQAAYPGLYTRTLAVLPWIQQNVDIAVAAPLPPSVAMATALAGGAALISWTPTAQAGAGAVTYTATAAPTPVSCSTVETACRIEGLTPGATYTVTVQGSSPQGAGAPSVPSAPFVAVNGTGKHGTSVTARKLATWAGVRGGSPTLRVQTKSLCVVKGTSVRLLKVGTCIVRVAAAGKAGRAYIAVK